MHYLKRFIKLKRDDDVEEQTQRHKTVIEREFDQVNHYNSEHALQLQKSNYIQIEDNIDRITRIENIQ